MCKNRKRLETKGTNPLDIPNRMFQSDRIEPASQSQPRSPPCADTLFLLLFFSTWKSCIIEPLILAPTASVRVVWQFFLL